VKGLCQLTDLVPMVFDVLGKPCPVGDLPGRTLVPEHFTPAAAAFAEWSPQHWSLRTVAEALGAKGFIEDYNARYRMIRTDDYKYIWSSDGKHSLYDVKNDPDEVSNLLTEEPQLAKELNDRLVQWFESQRDYLPAVRHPGSRWTRKRWISSRPSVMSDNERRSPVACDRHAGIGTGACAPGCFGWWTRVMSCCLRAEMITHSRHRPKSPRELRKEGGND